ncbi:MAG TPA: hypothetical protein VMS38_08320, partial [Pseudorhodoferax sp.]|nr:hypothetical protein [Pseudorhodoferax sp.]
LIAAGLIKEADLRERIADIRKKYEENKNGAAGAGESEVARLRARADEAEAYLKQLREQGPLIEKVTQSEKEAAKIREELKTSISGVTRSQKELALVEAERAAAAEKAIAAEQKRIDGLEKAKAAYASLIDSTRQEAQSIATQADELEATNAMWGKSRTAVEEYRLSVLKAKMAEVEGGSDSSYDPSYVRALQDKIDAQQRKVDAQRIADAKTLNEHAQEMLRNAQDASTLYETELRLMGLTADARARIVAERAIELKYAKELEKIEKSGASEPGKEAARRTLGDAKSAELSGLSSKTAVDSLKELDAYLDPARAKDFGSALKDAFGEAGNSLAQLTNAFQDYAQQQAELAKMQEKLRSSAGEIDQSEYHKREMALAKKSAQSQIGSYASIAGAAKGFFSEHSKGYKVMEAAEKGFRAVELALAVESMTKQLFGINAVTSATVTGESTKAAAVTSGTSAQVAADLVKGQSAAAVGVATQAQGDPYSALPRMAVMAAVMAGLGFMVGGFGGGGSSSAVREERQRTQGTGTVFGDAEAKSASLGNAFEMLQDSAKLELRYQSGMLASLRNIEGAMAGVANAVLRTQGITSGNSVGVVEGVISTKNLDPLLDVIGLGGLGASLFGKVTQEITDSGLVIKGLVEQLSRGEGFSSYTDITKTKSKLFGLSKSTSNETIFGELDADTNEALGRVFSGLSSALVMASSALGRDAAQVSEQIANTLIDIPRVSLRGLKGSDLQDAISSTISAAADTIGKTVVPGLDAFQKIGEGYFETLIRVSSGIESAEYALERFGISAVGFMDLVGKQGDVAAEIFRESVVKFEGAGSGMAEIINGISGSVDDLADTYRSLVD